MRPLWIGWLSRLFIWVHWNRTFYNTECIIAAVQSPISSHVVPFDDGGGICMRLCVISLRFAHSKLFPLDFHFDLQMIQLPGYLWRIFNLAIVLSYLCVVCVVFNCIVYISGWEWKWQLCHQMMSCCSSARAGPSKKLVTSPLNPTYM